MGNVATALAVLVLIGIGIVFNKLDRRAVGPKLRPPQAVKLVRTSKGTQFLNQLSAHRERGDLSRVALGGGGSGADYGSPVAVEPVFLAAGTSAALVGVETPAGLTTELLRGGFAGDTSREGDAAVARALTDLETVVLTVDEAPVIVADATTTSPTGATADSASAPATAVANGELSAAVAWQWLPPLAAGR